MNTPSLKQQIVKLKFRWTFSASFPKGNMPETQVKLSNRPVQPLPDMTYDISTVLYDNIDSIAVLGDFSDPNISTLEKHSDKWLSLLGTGIIKQKTGSGILVEEWRLEKIYPLAFYFVEIDESMSDPLSIEICWRYSKAIYWRYGSNTESQYEEEPDTDSIWN